MSGDSHHDDASPLGAPDASPPGLDELRLQAHYLWELVSSLDRGAIERVLRTHPKYAGRPPERLRSAAIKLRDAQEVVAREHGLGGWDEAVASDRGTRRWDKGSQLRQEFRALDFARRAGSKHTTIEHVLDALATPPDSTVAANVLSELGYESVATEGRGSPSGTWSTPAQQALAAFAAGLCLGLGDASLADEHLLMAFAYTRAGVDVLRTRNIDPHDVVAALAAAGVRTPPFAPPVPGLPPGPLGPRVYFRGSGEGLAPEIHRRYPPGTVHTGFNTSRWKPGWGWVDAEDEVPLEDIVRSVVTDPADVEVVPVWQAAKAERQAMSLREDLASIHR